MFINPEISKQLAAEHRRDLLADAAQQSLARQSLARQSLARQIQAEPGTARHRQPLINRLWRRLRPVTRPRLEPQV